MHEEVTYYIEPLQSPVYSAQKLWSLSQDAYLHGSPWTKDQFLIDLKQKNSHYFVLSNGEEWMGFISFQIMVDEVDITHIVVKKEFQHQGCASRLMDNLIEDLKSKQIACIFLEVRCSNKRAEKLYLKKGFEPLSKRKKYYHQPVEDGLVMRLVLRDVQR